MDESFQSSHATLIDALEAISEGFVVYGPDRALILCNSQLRNFYNYSEEDVAPGAVSKELGVLDIERGTIIIRDGQENPYIGRRENLEIGPPETFVVELSDGRTLLTHDRVTASGGIVSAKADISEQVRTQRALEEAKHQSEVANTAKSEFLASMSHELRTPLNAIIGFADFIIHRNQWKVSDDKLGEYANDILSSGEHLLSMVNSLLDISSIEAGKVTLDVVPLSIDVTVTEAVQMVAGRAKEKGLELTTHVPDDLPALYADRRAMQQILLNLMTNAIKYTNAGKISVSVVMSDIGSVIFTIADTGVGIPPDQIPNLTDPFKRVETNPHISIVEGWGLGLGITESLIGLHNGTLDINSTVGQGTDVNVTLPNRAP